VGAFLRAPEPKFFIQTDRAIQKWGSAQEQPPAALVARPAFDVLKQSGAHSQVPRRRQDSHAANISPLSLENGSDSSQNFDIAECEPHRSFSHASEHLGCVRSCRRKALGSVERLKLHKGFVEHRRNGRRIARFRKTNLNFRDALFLLRAMGTLLCRSIHIFNAVAPTVSNQ